MNRKVLLVDDSVALVQFLERKIRELLPDVEVHVAQLGAEAIQIAKELKPRLVLVDFMLRDMRGDEVCRMLYQDPATTLASVILFYGNGVDSRKVQEQNANIVHAFMKPFDAGQLIERMDLILSQPVQSGLQSRFDANFSDLGLATSKIVFRASKELVRLGKALWHVTKYSLTGTFRILLKREPIEVYCRNGQVLLASTKDVQLYSLDSPWKPGEIDRTALAMASKGQSDAGCPFFQLLTLRDAMDQAQAVELSHAHGLRLMSRAFEAERVYYEFEDVNQLPEFVEQFTANARGSIQWGLEAARQVSDETAWAMREFAPGNVPCFAAESSAILEHVALDADETEFVTSVDSQSSIEALAGNLGFTPEHACALAFRLSEIGVIQAWPSSVFLGE